MRTYKLAILETHPVPYRLPIYRALNRSPQINETVYFCSNISAKKHFQKGFGTEVSFPTQLKGFKYKFLKNYFFYKKFLPPRGLWNFGIIKEILRNDYDAIIIYGYGSFTAKIAIVVAKIKRLPRIFREEIDLIGRELSIKTKIKDTLFPLLFKQFSAFLCSYTRNKEFYLYYKVPKEKLFLHPCSVDNKFFQKESRKNRDRKDLIKKKFKINSSTKVILYIGRLTQRKRTLDLLKAYENIVNKFDIALVIGGDGPEKEELERYVKEKNIPYVHFLGFVEFRDTSELYSMADVFVIPSRHDPSPKVMNEAMNFRLPIVVSENVGTASDMIKGNGFICPVGDVTAIDSALKKILSNPKLAKKMGEQSLRIVNKWSPEADVGATLKVLKYLQKKYGKK